MEPTSSLAPKFYENIQTALRPRRETALPGAGETARATAASFIETLRRAETTSLDGMIGKADPQSVVTALASAEIAVQSAISIRDKVVESYQEILRMPV